MKRVITYGTFDLLHYGHINLLRRARELGDYLVVVVSSDEFNWNEKGKKCYFTYEQRKAMVEAIRYVDMVVPETNWDQKRTDVHDYDIDVFVISTAIGAYFGGMVALTGLPFYLSGKAKMKRCGSSLMTISSEGQNGYVTNVEAGLGLANTLSFHAARGYNFNEHLFLGGGVGCSGYLFTEVDEEYLDYVAVPVYADLRLTAGSKRVTPYIGGRLGCDIIGLDLYSSIEFGTNIRSAAGLQSESWWLGVKAECLGLELHTMGLTLGKSF